MAMHRPHLRIIASLLVLLGAAAQGCDDPDGETLATVFASGTGVDTTWQLEVLDMAPDREVEDAEPRPDIVLDIPAGSCASLEITDPVGVLRESTAVRCEYARQTWRGEDVDGDTYLTIVLESEVETEAETGAFVRDLVQLVIDDVAQPGEPLEVRQYELRYQAGEQQNFGVYSNRSGWVATSGEEPSAWGMPRGWLELVDEEGSRGRFELEVTRSGARYQVRGDFAASPAAGRLPEPAVR